MREPGTDTAEGTGAGGGAARGGADVDVDVDVDVIELAAHRSAVVVVDMQNDFCHAAGYYAGMGRDVAVLAEAVGPVRRLVERARSAGMPVVFTRLLHDPDRGAMQDRHRLVPRRWTARGTRLVPGSWGAGIVDELRPRPDELVVDKTGYSAFDGTGLEAWLRGHGVDTIVLAGVVGYACVLATGFAAFDRDFDVVLATDAVASWDERLGGATVAIVDLLLGQAVPARQLVISTGVGQPSPGPAPDSSGRPSSGRAAAEGSSQ